jgi:hypothetical protein
MVKIAQCFASGTTVRAGAGLVYHQEYFYRFLHGGKNRYCMVAAIGLSVTLPYIHHKNIPLIKPLANNSFLSCSLLHPSSYSIQPFNSTA